MTKAERIARIQRDLSELKSRLGRIEAETFAGKRNCDELADELKALETEKGTERE
jgi:hypothetical protein